MIRSASASILLGLLSLALMSSAEAGAPGPPAAPPPPVDVYLIAGQSNASRQGTLAKLPSWVTPDPRVWLFHSPQLKSVAPPLTWAPLRSASETVEKFGPEISFGNRMQQLTSDRPVALIKHAMTATNLKDAWKPGKDADDRAHWGPQFEAFVATVDAGLKALRDKGFDPILRGMIWQQGESDADFEKPAKEYAGNLSWFIARVREQFKAPDLVFVYGFVLGPPNDKQPFREAVRTAQGAIDQDSGSPWAVKNAFVVFTDDLAHIADDPNTTNPKDHVHLGTSGVWELGRRMAETMAHKGKLPR